MNKYIKKGIIAIAVCLGIYAFKLIIGDKVFGVQLSEGEISFLTWYVLFVFILPIANKMGLKISKIYKGIRVLNKDDFRRDNDYYRDLLKINVTGACT